jgi:hypothetical protein
MNFKKKSLFFLILGTVLLLLISGLFFRIYVSNRLEELDLKTQIKLFCKNNLDKAVKTENIYLDYKGNIVIQNFDLSISSDFNDNISLIKSSRLVFVPHISNLINGKLLIKEIRFKDSSLTIHKKFGKSYRDTINALLTFKVKPENIEHIDMKKLKIKFQNSSVEYREVFRTKKMTIRLSSVDAELNFFTDRLSYRVSGAIAPYKTASIKSGFLEMDGFLTGKTGTLENRIKIENFDLSYLNEFNKEYDIAGMSLNGGISLNFKLSFAGKKDFKSSGEIETNSLNIVTHTPPGHNILSNKNFNFKFDIGYSRDNGKFSINELRIYDDHINIPISGFYQANKKEEVLNFKVKPVKVDLSNISSYFSPVQNVSYNGTLDFSMDINYDYKIDKNISFSLISELTDFNAEWLNRGKSEKIIDNCNLKLTSINKNISLIFTAGIFKSDFNFAGDMNIDSWHPFRSKSKINIKSKQVEADLIYSWFKEAIDYLYSESFRDSKRGFEMIYFLQTPEAHTINNNNFSIQYNSEKLLFGKNAQLSGLSGELELSRGHLSLKDFTLKGYEGEYFLNFQGFFNRDYPFFEVKGHAKNLNIADFNRDYGSSFRASGTGSFECDFELNAFRISHLVEQGRGTMTLSLFDGSIENSSFQDRFSSFLDKNGYSNLQLSTLDIKQFNLTLRQAGKNFYIRNFILNSDKLNMATYGTYNYQKGIFINMFPNVYDTKKRMQRIPLRIRGPLLNPEIRIIKNRETKTLSFFDIN